MIEEVNCLLGFSMARTIRSKYFSMQEKIRGIFQAGNPQKNHQAADGRYSNPAVNFALSDGFAAFSSQAGATSGRLKYKRMYS